jgi:hypothetical protein
LAGDHRREPIRTVDWNDLTPAQVAAWYSRIDTIRSGRQPRLRAKPLEERELIWAIPTKVLIEA